MAHGSDKPGRPAGPNDPTRLIIRSNDSPPAEMLARPGAPLAASPPVASPPAPSGDAAATRYVHEAGTPRGAAPGIDPVVGWLVVVDGPGKGASRTVHYGQNAVGRGPGQRIALDFGDDQISREAHAYVVYDERKRQFFVNHGGRTNLVRRNGEPVMAPVALAALDVIEIGRTKLQFVPFCGPGFDWLASGDGENA